MIVAVAGLSRWFLSSITGVARPKGRGGVVLCRDNRRERATMFRKATLLLAVLVACATPSFAQPPLPFPPLPLPLPMPQGTPEERAACAPDVQKYCEAALPDTMRVLACLQSNRSRISNACNRVLVSHGQ
jgi:hypothetical protein